MEQLQKLASSFSQPYILEKPTIKECYIAYLDMLGYKAFFEEHPDKIEDMLTVLNEAIERMVGRLQLINGMFYRSTEMLKDVFKIKVFSDNILVYYEYKQTYEAKFLLLSFIELIKDFQINLITSYSIFLRGGIAKGLFTANDMFVFGQGLIDAVVLEEKQAIFPRIIIHQSVIDDLNAQISCKDSGICKVCKKLKEIDGLFVSGTSKEPLDRVINAYNTFIEIISAIPRIYCKPTDITDLCNDIRNQIQNIQLCGNNPKYLEREYQNVRNLTPRCINIFNSIVLNQINEYEKQSALRIKSSFFTDNDGFSVISYLDIPDFSEILTTEVLDSVIHNMKLLFPEYPSIVEEIEMLADQMKKRNHLQELLSIHKNRVEAEISDCMKQYESNKGKKQKLAVIEKVIKKYIWSMKYHNSICDKNSFGDMKIRCHINFDPIDDILLAEII